MHSQADRERIVIGALADAPLLVRALAEWVGRPLDGCDWQGGIPWRIEIEIAHFLRELNRAAPLIEERKP